MLHGGQSGSLTTSRILARHRQRWVKIATTQCRLTLMSVERAMHHRRYLLHLAGRRRGPHGRPHSRRRRHLCCCRRYFSIRASGKVARATAPWAARGARWELKGPMKSSDRSACRTPSSTCCEAPCRWMTACSRILLFIGLLAAFWQQSPSFFVQPLVHEYRVSPFSSWAH